MEFNESLASFIGENGALLFLKHKFREDSSEYKYYLSIKHDSEIFNEFINKLHDELDQIYQSQASDSEKENLKAEKIEEFKEYYKTLPFEINGYKTYLETLNLNNAVIISFKTYATDMSLFEEVLVLLNGDLPRFIRIMKQIPKGEDGFKYLEDYIKRQKSSE